MAHTRKKFFAESALVPLFIMVVLLVGAYVMGCGTTSSSSTSSTGSTGGSTGGSTSSSACSSVTAPSWDHAWPMFHGFENHLGRSTALGPQSTSALWTFSASTDVGNPPNSVAIDKNGVIYLAGGGKVYSISASSHTANWTKSYTSAQGPALSADGSVLYFGSDKSIVAVNTSDGSEKWTRLTGGAVHFGPTVGPDGTVYQGSWDKIFYALNPSDGLVKWSYTTAGAISYPPSIMTCADSAVGTLIILGGGDAHEGPDGNIYAFNTSGTLQWKYDTTQLRVGSPAITADGLIYAPGGPTLYVLNSSGALQWSLGDTSNEVSGIITPAIGADGTIYLSNSKGSLAAIDPATHAAKWTYSVGTSVGIPTFPVVDSAGTVYYGGTDNIIYAVNKDGTEVFHYATGDKMAEAAPALVSGVLYISSDDGKMYVFGP